MSNLFFRSTTNIHCCAFKKVFYYKQHDECSVGYFLIPWYEIFLTLRNDISEARGMRVFLISFLQDNVKCWSEVAILTHI